MIIIEHKDLNKLLEHLNKTFVDNGDSYVLMSLFGYDEQPTIYDISFYIFRHLHRKLSEYDVWIERSQVSFSETSNFEISDQLLKSLTDKFSAKLNTVAGKQNCQALFGDVETLTARDVAKLIVKTIEKIVKFGFEFDDFSTYIKF